MKYTSEEIDYILYRNDLELYNRIIILVKLKMDTIDEDRLSILMNQLQNLSQNIYEYSRRNRTREMFLKNYRNTSKEGMNFDSYPY
jgi:hypothetical protein